MRMYSFDFEVFAHDWLVIFKDIADNEFTVFHNDNYGVKQFATEEFLDELIRTGIVVDISD